MTIHVPTPYEVETASGRYVDLASPQPGSIGLGDIAAHLSRIPRYGGAADYSVAEHAVLVSRKLEAEGRHDLALAGLHHDDAEAYIGDVVRPLKTLLQRRAPDVLAELERRLDTAIARALGRPSLFAQMRHAVVRDADLWAVAVEARVLMPSRGLTWGLPASKWALPDDIADLSLGMPAPAASAAFIDRHRELTNQAGTGQIGRAA